MELPKKGVLLIYYNMYKKDSVEPLLFYSVAR